MSDLPCNCYHTKLDHHVIEEDFASWCVWSEVGQCPCDSYTPMDNLQYLEHLERIASLETIMKKKCI